MATITFKCIHCQQSIDAPPEAAGALCDCPNCQKEIMVPLVSDPAPVPVASPIPTPAPASVAAPVANAAAPKVSSGKFTVGSKKQMMRTGASTGTSAAVPQAKKKSGKGGVIIPLLIGAMIGYCAAAVQMLLGHGFGQKHGGGDSHVQVPVASTNSAPAVVADPGQVPDASTNSGTEMKE